MPEIAIRVATLADAEPMARLAGLQHQRIRDYVAT
jgi:hypothetical protein